jgi:hypothetical protein
MLVASETGPGNGSREGRDGPEAPTGSLGGTGQLVHHREPPRHRGRGLRAEAAGSGPQGPDTRAEVGRCRKVSRTLYALDGPAAADRQQTVQISPAAFAREHERDDGTGGTTAHRDGPPRHRGRDPRVTTAGSAPQGTDTRAGVGRRRKVWRLPRADAGPDGDDLQRVMLVASETGPGNGSREGRDGPEAPTGSLGGTGQLVHGRSQGRHRGRDLRARTAGSGPQGPDTRAATGRYRPRRQRAPERTSATTGRAGSAHGLPREHGAASPPPTGAPAAFGEGSHG